VEKHEREKKQNAGIMNSIRGRQAAALDARGAAMGSIGLIWFAFVVWKLLPHVHAVLVLVSGICVWLALSVLIWRASKTHWAR